MSADRKLLQLGDDGDRVQEFITSNSVRKVTSGEVEILEKRKKDMLRGLMDSLKKDKDLYANIGSGDNEAVVCSVPIIENVAGYHEVDFIIVNGSGLFKTILNGGRLKQDSIDLLEDPRLLVNGSIGEHQPQFDSLYFATLLRTKKFRKILRDKSYWDHKDEKLTFTFVPKYGLLSVSTDKLELGEGLDVLNEITEKLAARNEKKISDLQQDLQAVRLFTGADQKRKRK